MSKIIKIKAKVSFIHEDGTFIEAGQTTTVTDVFLQEQNTLCDLFSLPKHEVLEEAESQEDVVKNTKSKQKATQKQEDNNDL